MEGNWYLLDFFGLVPWLLSLDGVRTLRGTALCGLAMCTAFVLAIFAWFGFAIAVYSAGAAAAGIVVLALTAPLLQPQFIVFAVVRFVSGRHHGPILRALVGAAAWVATEWVYPKLLADSLAHGFYPSAVLRQSADIAGTAGITFVIVLINESLASAVAAARTRGARAAAFPLTAAAAITLAMVGYGQWRLSELAHAASDAKPVRVAMIQSNIAAYDRLKREHGAYDAVRYVLDTHFEMSRDAVDHDHVDALLWSETVFPTTFGRPKSDTGATLDREIEDFVSRLGVPLVFGTYDRDDDGEYNSAVFLEPGAVGADPHFGVYRKTRLFFLTEYIPWWMDNSLVRAWLPWAGTWKPGPGARVLPLRVSGGRSIAVLPMICLDDVDVGLAVEGARRGAQAIFTMSNDSWFAEHAGGAHLHLVVAAFRSIETRLPQLRVTSTGISAVIDATGQIVASAGVGERRALVGEIDPRNPPKTLVVLWGDWLGPSSLAFVLLAFAVPIWNGRAGRPSAR
ncbi:MAG TPA: apolipoprotein N-acyltransferase [Candidatus Binatia bacterium]